MDNIKKITSIIFIFSLFAALFPINQVEAKKSEKQIQYEQFKKLKMNSSVVDVSKVIYGKKYKSNLCDYNYDLNLLCFDQMESHNKRYKNGKIRYYNYTFKFFEEINSDYTGFNFRMELKFKSKDKSKSLKLVEKRWEDFDVVNMHNVYNNKKIKAGMTTKQIDLVTVGKGIGKYEAIKYSDYSKVGFQKGDRRPQFYDPYKTLYYTTMNQRLDVLYKYQMEYDYKKKSYIATYVLRYG